MKLVRSPRLATSNSFFPTRLCIFRTETGVKIFPSLLPSVFVKTTHHNVSLAKLLSNYQNNKRFMPGKSFRKARFGSARQENAHKGLPAEILEGLFGETITWKRTKVLTVPLWQPAAAGKSDPQQTQNRFSMYYCINYYYCTQLPVPFYHERCN